MAHFAEINNEGKVVHVIAVSNEKCKVSGMTEEQAGITFLNKITAFAKKTFVQTSYNRNFRVHYAGIGYIYDRNRDAFIPPKPTDFGREFALNEETFVWEEVVQQDPEV